MFISPWNNGGWHVLRFCRYWDIVERTVQQNPVDAALGGDPSPANKVRAFLNVQFYKGGAWESRFEVLHFRPKSISVVDCLFAAYQRKAALGSHVLLDQDGAR